MFCLFSNINTFLSNSYPCICLSIFFFYIFEGLPGVLRNKGTLANFWEQGNKIRKITVRKNSERVWEHGNIGQFWKGTREQGPPCETLIFPRKRRRKEESFLKGKSLKIKCKIFSTCLLSVRSFNYWSCLGL